MDVLCFYRFVFFSVVFFTVCGAFYLSVKRKNSFHMSTSIFDGMCEVYQLSKIDIKILQKFILIAKIKAPHMMILSENALNDTFCQFLSLADKDKKLFYLKLDLLRIYRLLKEMLCVKFPYKNEKRKFHRYRAISSLAVNSKCFEYGKQNILLNISAGGLCFITKSNILCNRLSLNLGHRNNGMVSVKVCGVSSTQDFSVVRARYIF